jgi:hypothetical protein
MARICAVLQALVLSSGHALSADEATTGCMTAPPSAGGEKLALSAPGHQLLTAEGKPVFVVEYPRDDEQAHAA